MSDTTTFPLALPTQLHRAAKQYAASTGTTMTALMRQSLMDALDKAEFSGQPIVEKYTPPPRKPKVPKDSHQVHKVPYKVAVELRKMYPGFDERNAVKKITEKWLAAKGLDPRIGRAQLALKWRTSMSMVSRKAVIETYPQFEQDWPYKARTEAEFLWDKSHSKIMKYVEDPDAVLPSAADTRMVSQASAEHARVRAEIAAMAQQHAEETKALRAYLRRVSSVTRQLADKASINHKTRVALDAMLAECDAVVARAPITEGTHE